MRASVFVLLAACASAPAARPEHAAQVHATPALSTGVRRLPDRLEPTGAAAGETTCARDSDCPGGWCAYLGAPDNDEDEDNPFDRRVSVQLNTTRRACIVPQCASVRCRAPRNARHHGPGPELQPLVPAGY